MINQHVENHNALLCIAKEIKKFQDGQILRNDKKYFKPVFDNCRWYKTRIKAKKVLISTLKKKLNIACMFAKILMTANKGIDMHEIHQIRKQKEVNMNKSNDLTTKLINIAYKELCSIQDESITDIDKLKTIICLLNNTANILTQEKLKVENLERKNKFLSTKLMLTENHLRHIMDENSMIKTESVRLARIHELRNGTYPEYSSHTTLNSFISNRKTKIKMHLANMTSLVNEQTKILKELEFMSKKFEQN